VSRSDRLVARLPADGERRSDIDITTNSLCAVGACLFTSVIHRAWTGKRHHIYTAYDGRLEAMPVPVEHEVTYDNMALIWLRDS
jgi:hypothetical protein